jgi:hypothetical protein
VELLDEPRRAISEENWKKREAILLVLDGSRPLLFSRPTAPPRFEQRRDTSCAPPSWPGTGAWALAMTRTRKRK